MNQNDSRLFCCISLYVIFFTMDWMINNCSNKYEGDIRVTNKQTNKIWEKCTSYGFYSPLFCILAFVFFKVAYVGNRDKFNSIQILIYTITEKIPFDLLSFFVFYFQFIQAFFWLFCIQSMAICLHRLCSSITMLCTRRQNFFFVGFFVSSLFFFSCVRSRYFNSIGKKWFFLLWYLWWWWCAYIFRYSWSNAEHRLNMRWYIAKHSSSLLYVDSISNQFLNICSCTGAFVFCSLRISV